MRVSQIELKKFRRFSDLKIQGIPQSAKLVVLAGPNGSGKSSLFDSLLLQYRMDAGLGWSQDAKYYDRSDEAEAALKQRIKVATHCGGKLTRGSVYMRTAYRNDPEFTTRSLTQQDNVLDTLHLNRLIDPDATVSKNYQRLASQAMEDVFVKEDSGTTIGDFRDKLIGQIREPLMRLFPDLIFVGVGNPLAEGSFQFDKGVSKGIDYKNLSGGEKAAFDLILDFVVKRTSYPDAIYCIDEPEAHMNTRLQAALLYELVNLLPGDSQLWVASHSIGMMRKARELYYADPASVVFIDFGGKDFDQPVVLNPSKPTRSFWASVLNVALDDLAVLVAPSEVVICEGNPRGTVAGKNAEHDAQIYKKIFGDDFPDTTFISAGNSKEVQSDFVGLATVLPNIASGIKISRLIDLDDHAPDDVADFKSKGINVLSSRHLECYLYDDEVLSELCSWAGHPELAPDLIAIKEKAIEKVVANGFPADDLKKAAGNIYVEAKKLLSLKQVGNDAPAFARQTLANLIKPGMGVYERLKQDVFGR
ncbi:hypothetical protein A9D60_19510 [Leisingera sp. JC1]|nr:hypothetical protein A9D60_19510 [Leisingera sp. JC1]